MKVVNYFVHPGARVRSEDFGLLFYNTADTKLTFVKCGTSVQLSFGDGSATQLMFSCDDEGESKKASDLLKRLTRKGLIVEAGTCIQQ
jgi:putative mycofactocin binding protein MftB